MSDPTLEAGDIAATPSGTPPHVDLQPRDLSAAERLLLVAAQNRLDQQRQHKQAVAESARTKRERSFTDFARALRENEQPTLPFTVPTPRPVAPIGARNRPQKTQATSETTKARLGRFETPVRPAGVATIPATLEAALEQARTFQPGSPAALAREALERARPVIEGAVKRKDARHNLLVVYEALALAAYTSLSAQGQSPLVTSCVYFTVMDTLQIVTGLSSDQCERATRRLQDLGLIHKSSGALPTNGRRTVTDKAGQTHERKVYMGGTWTTTEFVHPETGAKAQVPVCAGTWLCVLLRPSLGLRAQVRSHELPECPRDLTADRKTGNTAWQMLHEFKERVSKVRESLPPKGRYDITPLLAWTLPKSSYTKSVTEVDTRRSSSPSYFAASTSTQDAIWGLRDILHEHPQHRREAIQQAGRTLAAIFHDTHSIKHYWRVLWRATAAEHRGVAAYQEVQEQMIVTLAEMSEVSMTAPGGWLIKKLKKCTWWDAVYRATEVMPQSAA